MKHASSLDASRVVPSSRRSAAVGHGSPPAVSAPETALKGIYPATNNPRRWWGLAVLAAALAMIILDATIVGVATPAIVDALGLTLTDAQWVAALYSMIFAALLLIVGRLADRVGRRTILVVGIVLFTAASMLAGMATGAGTLLAARALQGVGGAMILPTTLSTVNATFTGPDRARAFGVWGAVMAGAAALGPLLGGWLTTTLDWRWIFFVNVPIGAVLLVGIGLTVPQTRGRAGRGWDVGGLLTSAFGLALMVFGLIEGHTLGWVTPQSDFTLGAFSWSTTRPVALTPIVLGAGLALLVAFAVLESRRTAAGCEVLLDTTLFHVPTFTWGNITAATVAAAEFSLVFVMPLFLVNAQGLTIMQAGLVLAAMALGALFSGGSARHLAARWSPSGVVVLGLALELVGMLGLAAAIKWGGAAWTTAPPFVVYGLGLGLASAQLTSTVLGDIPPQQSGTASATQSTVRQVGSAFGTALAGTVLAGALNVLLPQRLDAIDGLSAGVAERFASGTVDSAGGLIPALSGPAGAQIGDPHLVEPVVTALSGGFADATVVSILASTALLALGLVGALRVRGVAHRGAKASSVAA